MGDDITMLDTPRPDPLDSSTPGRKVPGTPGIVPLHGGFQHYAWGTVDELPAFFGVAATGEPFAEWWLGAHRALPATVDGEPGAALDALIAADPSRWLGDAAARFGDRLPFLLKILSIGAPLSLQVHPSLAAARAGFDRENAEGLAVDAPNRNYRDPNHKPELIVALSPFRALCGFAPVEVAAARLDGCAGGDPDLAALAASVRSATSADDLRSIVAAVLTVDADRAARWTERVVAGADGAGAAHLRELAERYPGDPGVIVAALLNHVVLAPGDALFLDHGQLHAYLHGFGLELMANSDNVLRGGLTPKHIDVPELLAVLRPAPGPVDVLRAHGDEHVQTWATPCRDFELQRVEPPHDGMSIELGAAPGPRLLVCVEGSVFVEGSVEVLAPAVELARGSSLYVLPGAELRVRTDAHGVVFVAGVPAG